MSQMTSLHGAIRATLDEVKVLKFYLSSIGFLDFISPNKMVRFLSSSLKNSVHFYPRCYIPMDYFRNVSYHFEKQWIGNKLVLFSGRNLQGNER